MIDWQEAYSGLMSLCNEKDAEIERLRALVINNSNAANRFHLEIERLRTENEHLIYKKGCIILGLKERNAELLEALKTVMGDATHGQNMMWTARCERARAVIEKAENE